MFQALSCLRKMARMPSSQWHSICAIKHHCLVSQGEPISSVSESRLHRCTHTARVYRASWSWKVGDAEEAELSTVIQECLQAKTRGSCQLLMGSITSKRLFE